MIRPYRPRFGIRKRRRITRRRYGPYSYGRYNKFIRPTNRFKAAMPLVHVGLAPMPMAYVTTLHYHDYVGCTGGAGIDAQDYRGNSVYDPDYTGAGGQPSYFDQITAIYGRYCVFASSITVEMHNSDAVPTSLDIVPDTSSAALVNAAQARQFANNKHIIVGTDGTVRKLKHYFTTAQAWDCSDPLLDPDLSALYNANPVKVWFWHLMVQNTDGGANSTSLDVDITYIVRFNAIQPKSD